MDRCRCREFVSVLINHLIALIIHVELAGKLGEVLLHKLHQLNLLDGGSIICLLAFLMSTDVHAGR